MPRGACRSEFTRPVPWAGVPAEQAHVWSRAPSISYFVGVSVIGAPSVCAPELAGPVRLHMGGPMMLARGPTIAFPRKGVYRLGTKTVEMPGGMMEVKTIGS